MNNRICIGTYNRKQWKREKSRSEQLFDKVLSEDMSKNVKVNFVFRNFKKFQITFITLANQNSVIGLQKRYDPSKTYYFIMDVVWSDGSQLMIYRHGQKGKFADLEIFR